MLIDNLDDLPNSFKTGYRGILLICRNKDGQVGNAQRASHKVVTKGMMQWEETIEKFRHMQKTSYPSHRIYSSVNPKEHAKGNP